jgi:hypothetical protein
MDIIHRASLPHEQAMSTIIVCPQCQKKYRFETHPAARQVRCKACQTSFAIPTPKPAADGELQLAAAPTPSSTPPRRFPPSILSIVQDSPAPAADSHKLWRILGPPTTGFWLFAIPLLTCVPLVYIPAWQTIGFTILIASGFVFLLAGAATGLRILHDDGIPLRLIWILIRIPLVGFILFTNDMLKDKATYRIPLFTQLRGLLLIFVAILAMITTPRSTDNPYLPVHSPPVAPATDPNAAQ